MTRRLRYFIAAALTAPTMIAAAAPAHAGEVIVATDRRGDAPRAVDLTRARAENGANPSVTLSVAALASQGTLRVEVYDWEALHRIDVVKRASGVSAKAYYVREEDGFTQRLNCRLRVNWNTRADTITVRMNRGDGCFYEEVGSKATFTEYRVNTVSLKSGRASDRLTGF